MTFPHAAPCLTKIDIDLVVTGDTNTHIRMGTLYKVVHSGFQKGHGSKEAGTM